MIICSIAEAERYEAFVKLLAMPEPFDLPPRRSILTQKGAPGRQEMIMPQLIRTYCEWRIMQTREEPNFLLEIR